ncbi:hypothetical protein [Methanosarcina sp. KYL-1]|nr:hypothetical protein [Methanosarcina sp. KYL-1]
MKRWDCMTIQEQQEYVERHGRGYVRIRSDAEIEAYGAFAPLEEGSE